MRIFVRVFLQKVRFRCRFDKKGRVGFCGRLFRFCVLHHCRLRVTIHKGEHEVSVAVDGAYTLCFRSLKMQESIVFLQGVMLSYDQGIYLVAFSIIR